MGGWPSLWRSVKVLGLPPRFPTVWRGSRTGSPGTDINFAAPSPRVRPLREMFATSTDWSREQDGAAQELARAHRWDCATTRISLVPGTYHMVVDRGGAHIETDSEPKITRTIDQHRFFDFLAKSAIKPGVEARVRKRFFA